MKLIPFYLRESFKNSFKIQTLTLFLGYAGKSVWTTEESGFLNSEQILKNYCEPNGIFVKSIHIEKDRAYIEVDEQKTNLSEFYTWEEALRKPGKPECWRRFYFLHDKEGGEWWSPKGLIEAEIQGLGNVEEIYRHLRTSSYI